MRVSTICLVLIVVLLIIVGIGWFFGGIDGLRKFAGGYQAASTPTEAIERFRDAIQKRKYKWAATYTTKDYGEILEKADADAAALGSVIDKIRERADNLKVQNDTTIILLNYLDPFPGNFKIQGDVKSINEKQSVGYLVWETLPISQTSTLNSQQLQLDGKMFQRLLVPPAAFAKDGVKIVKDGEHWKLDIPAQGMSDGVRYFLDNAKKYESELRNYHTYMSNDRYDSAKAFEVELLKPLQKAAK